MIWLLAAAWLAKRPSSSHHLAMAWAFAAGVLYMALFGGLDELQRSSQAISEYTFLLSLIGVMLGFSLLGLACSIAALRKPAGTDTAETDGRC